MSNGRYWIRFDFRRFIFRRIKTERRGIIIMKKQHAIIILGILFFLILFSVFYLGKVYGGLLYLQELNETVVQTIKIECYP